MGSLEAQKDSVTVYRKIPAGHEKVCAPHGRKSKVTAKSGERLMKHYLSILLLLSSFHLLAKDPSFT